MITEPPVRFGRWTSWGERKLIKNAHLPGVYLLAQWDGAPPAIMDPLARAIIYIGEIADGSLLGRWQQFERAAFQGKPGHRGGLAYREMIGDQGESLFVAAFVPEGLNRAVRPLFIRHVHTKLIWEWARQWDFEPTCNTRGA